MRLQCEGIFEVVLDGSLEHGRSLVQIDDFLAIRWDGLRAERPAFPFDAAFIVRIKISERSEKHRLTRTRRAGQGESVTRTDLEANTP
jgi:hypothetical protein